MNLYEIDTIWIQKFEIFDHSEFPLKRYKIDTICIQKFENFKLPEFRYNCAKKKYK